MKYIVLILAVLLVGCTKSDATPTYSGVVTDVQVSTGDGMSTVTVTLDETDVIVMYHYWQDGPILIRKGVVNDFYLSSSSRLSRVVDHPPPPVVVHPLEPLRPAGTK